MERKRLLRGWENNNREGTGYKQCFPLNLGMYQRGNPNKQHHPELQNRFPEDSLRRRPLDRKRQFDPGRIRCRKCYLWFLQMYLLRTANKR